MFRILKSLIKYYVMFYAIFKSEKISKCSEEKYEENQCL